MPEEIQMAQSILKNHGTPMNLINNLFIGLA